MQSRVKWSINSSREIQHIKSRQECRNDECNDHRPVQNSAVEIDTTSYDDFDDGKNCIDFNVNNLDNTAFATCIKDISIAEEIAGNGDELKFGPHVQEVQLEADEWTANPPVSSPA